MNVIENYLQRPALMAAIVRNATPGFGFGRTALMKCVYFLQTLRGVPLPYSFSLHTYGPFDAAVLEDLRYAESLRAIESTIVQFPGGSRYELSLGPKADEIEAAASSFLDVHRESIEWTAREFGRRSAADLEMTSTIVYVDRDFAAKRKTTALGELVRLVKGVKPYLSPEAISRESERLIEKGLLRATA